MKFGSGVTLRFEGAPNHPNPEAPSCDIWEHEQEWKKRYRRITDHGTAFEGTDGWVHVDRTGLNLQPENLIDADESTFKVQLTRSPDHVRNFLDCVKSRAETVAWSKLFLCVGRFTLYRIGMQDIHTPFIFIRHFQCAGRNIV